MNSGEALVIVKKLKNHYQAFEKLEEVLKAVVAAEDPGTISRLEKRKKKLSSEVESMESQVADLSGELSMVGNELDEKRLEAQKRHSEFMKGMGEETKKAKATHEALMASLSTEYNKRRDELEASTKELGQKRVKEERLLANAREAVAKTREGLERVA